MAQSQQLEEFKILLIGDVRVGKTSFLTRYTRNVINKNEQPTIGVDYQTKSIVLQDGTVVKAKMWDTAGSEKYKAITTAHYRKSVGALLFFDLTDRMTFDHTLEWLSLIKEHIDDNEIVIMLVGNKQDLVQENPGMRKVSESEARGFAKENGLLYEETSAKTGSNVKEAFQNLVETIYQQQKLKKQNNQQQLDEEQKIKIRIKKNFNKTDEPEVKKSDCC